MDKKFIAVKDGTGYRKGDMFEPIEGNPTIYAIPYSAYLCPTFSFNQLEESSDFEEYVELWVPKLGGAYYTMNEYGLLETKYYSSDKYQKARFNVDVVFKTSNDCRIAIQTFKQASRESRRIK